MKLLDKFKNLLFEEEEEEEKEKDSNVEIAKKIDTKKEIKEEHEHEDKKPEINRETRFGNIDIKKEEEKHSPIIFDDDDFVLEPKKEPVVEKPSEIKGERILYGGYTEKKTFEKEKFKPSPIISPVYGILDKNYSKEEAKQEKKSLDHLFVEERKKNIDLDSIREKAYGEYKEKEEEESKELFYDISNNDAPSISKVTLGDAEEYFADLGLEYNVDYKDSEKEKVTRSTKNKELSLKIEDEINKDQKQIEEVEPVKEETDEITIPSDEIEEKNLYDLIDMMYDSKEE